MASERAVLFYYDDHFGFAHVPGHGSEEGPRLSICERMAQALCNAAAGDHESSKKEIQWIQGYLAVKGYPEEIIDKIPDLMKEAETKTPEQVGNDTKGLIDFPGLREAARVIIYDNLRAAGADGLHPDEEKVVKIIAANMGVPDEVVDQIKEQIKKEEDLKIERIALLYPNGYSCLRPEYQPGSLGK